MLRLGADCDARRAHRLGEAKPVAAESTPRRAVLQVPPSNGEIWLRITSTAPEGTGDYLRNIRILAPGLEDSIETFHPLFLERTAAYRLLRFVQWMDINGSSLTTWDERPRITNARWSSPSRGVPAEAAIALANRRHADAWLPVPHQADDDFVQRYQSFGNAGALEFLDQEGSPTRAAARAASPASSCRMLRGRDPVGCASSSPPRERPAACPRRGP